MFVELSVLIKENKNQSGAKSQLVHFLIFLCKAQLHSVLVLLAIRALGKSKELVNQLPKDKRSNGLTWVVMLPLCNFVFLAYLKFPDFCLLGKQQWWPKVLVAI